MKLFESIQIKDGVPQRLEYHNERMNRSRNALFCLLEEVYLEEFIQVPPEFSLGMVKCRIVYGEQIEQMEFQKYEARQHDSFFLVNASVDYAHKLSSRKHLEELKAPFSPSSEIIIVRNNFITDTTYSNLIFKDKMGEWFTPETYLLQGTQREYLLDEGLISERKMDRASLKDFTHFMMINAMLDFDEKRAIDIHKISNL